MLARDLRYFLVLVDHRHVGRAAAALGLSQPALSKSLRRLEEMAEAQLFERSRHGIALTASGRTLAERARGILREIDAALEEVQAFQGAIKGTVRVGAIPTICEQYLPQAISGLVADHGDIQVSVSSNWNESLFAMLDAGETDLIVTGLKAPMTNARYICRPVLHDQVGVVCRAGHAFLASPKPKAAVLASYSWAMAGGMAPGRQWLEERFAEHRLPRPVISVETDSLVLAREVVLRSDLFGFLPYRMVRAEVDAGRMIWAPVPDLTWQRTIYAVHLSSRRLTASARLLISWLDRASASG
jgi:DNA-binding transcriptional LysR family regulator